MTSYNPSQQHRHSIRLQGYDYSQTGAYFITICVENRECLFGEIVDAEMHLNMLGEIIVKWWHELPCYYPPVQLDEFVVMPNHVHGIIVIGEGADAREGETEGSADAAKSKAENGADGRAAAFALRTPTPPLHHYTAPHRPARSRPDWSSALDPAVHPPRPVPVAVYIGSQGVPVRIR